MFKRFVLVFIGLTMISAAVSAADITFPALTGRVVDNAHILDPAVIQQLDNQIGAHEQESSDQIVVVTVPDLHDLPIEEFGYKLGRAWAIGQKKKNNGVLLIIAPKEHRARIEVGYGLEGVLTDAASSVIINRLITPEFKKGDYNKGVMQGVQGIIDTIRGENVNDLPQQSGDDISTHKIILLMVFFLFLLWLRHRGSGVLPFLGGWTIGSSGIGGSDDDDDGPSFSGGGGSFGGGGSSGSW
jgi:uncharacterized protein